MDANILKDIDRYYTLSEKIAGDLGCDLLHFVLLQFENKRCLDGEDLYRYFSRILKNEYNNKDSGFNKQYNPIIKGDFDTENSSCYDGTKLNKILIELTEEGHEHKVNLFMDVMYKRTTVKKIAEEMNVSRMYIYRNFITFIRNEIRERYEF